MGVIYPEVRDIIREVIGPDKPDEALEHLARILDGGVTEQLPDATETAAIATDTPMTAALCYDRVWSTERHVPEGIAFRGRTRYELAVSAYLGLIRGLNGIGQAEAAERAYNGFAKLYEQLDVDETRWPHRLDRAMADAIFKQYRIPVVTVQNSIENRDRLYKAGNYSVIVTTLSDVAVIDEGRLTWDQVLEFRKDKIARRALRRIRHWLDAEMIGKAASFIHDEIALRLENYDVMLQKHGIQTTLGVLSSTLDGKFLVGSAAIVASTNLVASPALAVVAGAGLVVGRVAVQLAQTLLDAPSGAYESHSEISFVIQAKNQLGTSSAPPNSR